MFESFRSVATHIAQAIDRSIPLSWIRYGMRWLNANKLKSIDTSKTSRLRTDCSSCIYFSCLNSEKMLIAMQKVNQTTNKVRQLMLQHLCYMWEFPASLQWAQNVYIRISIDLTIAYNCNVLISTAAPQLTLRCDLFIWLSRPFVSMHLMSDLAFSMYTENIMN